MSDTNILRMAWAAISRVFRLRRCLNAEGSPSSDLNGAHSLYRRGLEHIRAGRWRDGLAALDRAVVLSPKFADAVEARAELLDAQGNLDLAAENYARARQLYAAGRAGMPDRRYVFRRKGSFAFEVESYRLVRDKVKKKVLPMLAQGNALLSQGRAEEALTCYLDTLRTKPDLLDAIALKGEALLKLGKYREALEAFDRILEKNSRDAETLNSRGIANIALGRVVEAVADWGQQLNLLPETSAAARGCVALRMGKYDLAVREFERAAANEASELYWHLYHFVARRMANTPLGSSPSASGEEWPGRLISFLFSPASPDVLLDRADSPCRRAEAHFVMGIAALPVNRDEAARHWQEVVAQDAPHLIEFAVARRELTEL